MAEWRVKVHVRHSGILNIAAVALTRPLTHVNPVPTRSSSRVRAHAPTVMPMTMAPAPSPVPLLIIPSLSAPHPPQGSFILFYPPLHIFFFEN